MGIYSDYGRFVKAREFKKWCNSGAGIWFGFGLGSPEWDKLVEDSQGIPHLNVPPSAPNLYAPVYRWFKSMREIETGDPDYILQPQELSLIDRSYWGTVSNIYPDDSQIVNNPNLPPNDYIPLLSFYDSTTHGIASKRFGLEGYYNMLHSSTPVFPNSYVNDWSSRVNTYNNTSNFDPDNEPTDPTKYEEFAYNYHIYYSGSSNIHQTSNVMGGAPLGLLSMIQGVAHFVEPVNDTNIDTPTEALKKFKYGSHYWRIVPDSEITRHKLFLPHHILLTVSVFPNELSNSALVERELPVRQVSVFKFPESMIEELQINLNQPIPRSKQVIKRENINMVYETESEDEDIIHTETSQTRINIPFSDIDPMDGETTIELIINDFMTARKRDVQQTDRYGYIIGF